MMDDDVINLKSEISRLKDRLREAEQTIEAIQRGEADAIVIDGSNGKQIYSLVGPDHPYRIFIETMNEGAINLSKEGTILYCNERFASMVQVPLRKVTGTSFWRFFEKKQQTRLKKMMKEKKEGKAECMLISSNHESLIVYLSFSSVSLKNIDFFCVLITDITEKEVNKEALEVINKKLAEAISAQDYFLAGMNHNLRTPLNSILGFSDTLLMKLPGPLTEKQETQLKIISRCSHQLLSLIDQLLDLSKLKNGNLQPILEEIEINKLLKQLVEEVQPLASNKKLDLSLTLLAEPIKLISDKRMLRQIFLNLLDNAIKYTARGSITITLNKQSKEKQLEIHITDTGVGIKKEELENIFEAYCKVSSQSGRYNEHTGLGLYLCRQFSQLLGIKLECKSIPNQGSTFSVLIPLKSQKHATKNSIN